MADRDMAEGVLARSQGDQGDQAAQGDGAGISDDDVSREYLQARDLLLTKLYEEGAADGLARTLAQAPSPAQGIVDQSMTLIDLMEEATQGAVPDEEAMSFVLDIVQEVVDIARAAGLQVADRDIAEAVREVLARVIESLGGDSTAVREEMGQLDPEQVGAAAAQMGG